MTGDSTRTIDVAFDNSYARLPERFYAKLPPTPVEKPKWIKLNIRLAKELGLDAEGLASAEGLAALAGNALPDGAEPIAMAYAGHQFGQWVPQLGDGRAVLLGEVVDPKGNRWDVQLKGAGPTPFSRMGDGRAALGPVLREYIVSEAMAALGVPTTRALAAVATGERVMREQPLPGAVLTRVAKSHVRVGTFQYFAARDDTEALKLLVEHVIDRHYSDLAGVDGRYRALIEAVAHRQARLVAQWQCLGFIHGVMNTDNMSIAGETIDYGPCAFMDTYKASKVFSAIDRAGRYAYQNQPAIANWNLACFAQCLLPFLGSDDEERVAEGKAAIGVFPGAFARAWQAGMARKLGFTNRIEDLYEPIAGLANDLLALMEASEADFTLAFRSLSDPSVVDGSGLAQMHAIFPNTTAFGDWATSWRDLLTRDEDRTPEQRAAMMKAANPIYIPRNHRVEEAIAAAHDGSFEPFERLIEVLADPFVEREEHAAYAAPPEPDEVVRRTFCGT